MTIDCVRKRACGLPYYRPRRVQLATSLAALGLLASASLWAADAPQWLRDPALSHACESVAFRSGGDLYVTTVRTGQARVLAGTPAHETRPVWLPDDKSIAFAADTHGSYDVFTIAADGSGEPQRITWHARHELPVGTSPDGTELLVRSGRIDVDGFDVYPFQLEGSEDNSHPLEWAGLFAMPLAGGLPRPLVAPASLDGSWDTTGQRVVFSVRPATDNIYRKHDRSPANRDIWLREADGRSLRRLTSSDSHDTTPVWSPVDGHVYFLSERSGSFNVWRMPVEGDARAEQVTHHESFPVRGLSICKAGNIAYSFRGELYAGTPGSTTRVPVRLPRGPASASPHQVDLHAAISEAVLVSATREAIVTARGRIFAVDRWSTQQREVFTEHLGMKSAPTLSADGRRLLVVHDLGDRSELLLAELVSTARTWTDAASSIRVTALARTTDIIVRAALSPDGKRAVFTGGTSLKITNVTTKAAPVTLAEHALGSLRTSSSLSWHPAGRHLALEWTNRERRSHEIVVLDTTDGAVTNVTQSGFSDTTPRWSADGRSLLWLSDREALAPRTGYEGPTDTYVLFLDPLAWRAHKARRELREKPIGADELARLLLSLREDPALLAEHRVRLTPASASNQVFSAAPSGRYLLRLEDGRQNAELWLHPLPQGEPYRAWKSAQAVASGEHLESQKYIGVTADEREALLLTDGTARWIELATGKDRGVDLKSPAAHDPAAQRRWIFEHVVRSAERLYYRPDYLRDARWSDHVAEYRRVMPAITHPADFSEVMQELLGELNASHTSFHYQRKQQLPRTGSLGVRYDPQHRGPGLRLAQVLPSSALTEARAGDVIISVNGMNVASGADPARLLADTEGKEIDLVLDRGGARRQLKVTPTSITGESEIFYRRWVEHRRRETERLSGGRLGYVHLPWMGEEPFRQLIDASLGGLVAKRGIVLDLRYNQGGWLHGPLLSFLTAPFAFTLKEHGIVWASEPELRVGRPLAALVNAAGYSNGFEIPRLLRERSIAPLVGEAMPGTGLGGRAEPLPFAEFSYGVAHGVSLTADGQYWEGPPLAPDVIIPADRAAPREGRDVQLEAAVKLLMSELDRAAGEAISP